MTESFGGDYFLSSSCVFFFVSAYALRFMHIDKRLFEKKGIEYAVYGQGMGKKHHRCGYAVLILIPIHIAVQENICTYALISL